MKVEVPARNILLVIPVRNETAALQELINSALTVCPNILVVDDFSDSPVTVSGAAVIRHSGPLGRGASILTGAREASRLGMTHIVTINNVVELNLPDLSLLVAAVSESPAAVVITSRHFSDVKRADTARRVAQFWLRVQTGRSIPDVQNGFRAYPVQVLLALKISSQGIAFEPEVLTRAAWAGIDIREVSISRHYEPAHYWASGFRLFLEYFRWVMLTIHLTMRSTLPWPHRRLIPDMSNRNRITILHPLRSLRALVAANTSPRQIALAVVLGVFLGTIPLLFIHSIAIILLAGFFRLNKPAALLASQLCMPPFVPALCIEVGYFLRNGRFLTEFSLQTLGYQAWDRFIEWIIGSLFLAPPLAVIIGLAVFVMAQTIARSLKQRATGSCRADGTKPVARAPSNEAASGTQAGTGAQEAARAPHAYRSRKWQGKSRGGVLGNWFFLKVIGFLGIRAAHVFLVPITAYYLVASPRSVRCSRRYLLRVLGPRPPWKWPFLIYRHFYSLGMSLLDRFAMLMGHGDSFSCSYENEDSLARALEHGKGAILVGAHVGNWAAGGHLLRRLKTRVNLVALENEVESIQRMFDRAFPDKGFTVLSSSPDLSSSLAIMNALRSGQIVVFNGDRTVEGTGSAEAVFFGAPAMFPVGPYLMASVTGSPVIQVFAMREGIGRYRFFCSPPTFITKTSGRSREEMVAAAANDFAASLEAVLRKYPFQWYNFYPFWKDDK